MRTSGPNSQLSIRNDKLRACLRADERLEGQKYQVINYDLLLLELAFKWLFILLSSFNRHNTSIKQYIATMKSENKKVK